MTLSIANKPAPSSASSKFGNSILGSFKEKLKNYIFRDLAKKYRDNALPLIEETDPKKLELEAMKNMAYSSFWDQVYIFLSDSRLFSIKYLDSFKERILREKEPLFSKNENLEMLFLIDLIKDIRKLKQKISKNKDGIFKDNIFNSCINARMEDDINEMTCKLYNNLPEDVFFLLENDRIGHELNEIEKTAKAFYPDNIEAQESYLRLHGFV